MHDKMKIGTVMFGVRDMEKAMAFYKDVLGMEVKLAGAEVAFLDAGGVLLALRHAADLGPVGDERRAEIVLHVHDVQWAYEHLRARGVTFRVIPRVVTGDRWAADFRDPDGNVWSIFGPNPSVPKE